MRHSIILSMWITFSVLVVSAFAVGEFKVTAEDAEEEDNFGQSVSIDGDYAIVGARNCNVEGEENAGSAYIFVRDEAEWIQQAILTPDSIVANRNFGFSVSIDGNYAIVSERAVDGSAYIFYKDGDDWIQQSELLADDHDGRDWFGWSVSISGNYAIVGAWWDNDEEGNSSGSAYIFVRDGEDWTQQAKLIAEDADDGDNFGRNVSISGNYAIIGAREDDDNGNSSGSAYIFVREDETWTQQAKLTAYDAEEQDRFGYCVSINENLAIVGAPYHDAGGGNAGAAYTFLRTENRWSRHFQHSKLNANDAAPDDQFGLSVSIDSNYCTVGAWYNDDGGDMSGSAYIFILQNDGWHQQVKHTAEDAARNDFFGQSVSIGGDYAIIGAYGDDNDGSGSGSAYVYFADPQKVSIVPDSLDFGVVHNIGESEELNLAVTNEGNLDLTVLNIEFDGNYFGDDFEDLVILEPKDTLVVVVTFSPEELGEFSGTLTITSDDPYNEEITVELYGTCDTEIKFNSIEFYENVNAHNSNPFNLIDPNRIISFKVLVVNELDRNVLMGTGVIESLTEGIQVVEGNVAFNNIRSGQSGWSIREFEVAIDENFEPGDSAWFRLTVSNEVEPEGPWISSFSFPIAPLMTSRFLLDDDDNPDSFGDDDNTAEPREIVELIPLIGNVSPHTWYEVSGQLQYAGQGNFIDVWNEVEGATGVVYDRWQYNFINNQQQPIEPNDENIQPEEDFVFYYREEAQEVYELPFDLIMIGYHNEAPGDAWDNGGVLMKWSSRFLINEGEGEVSVNDTENTIPTEFILWDPYPNPFNATTILTYGLPESADVSLQVYSLNGRLIATLVNDSQAAGVHSVVWNGADVPAGIYFVRMQADGFTDTAKLTLVR